MNQFSSDWAARKHNREMDRLQGETAAGAVLDSIADNGAALATIGAVVAPAAAPVLGIARATFGGLGLFRKAWKLGRPSVDQMIEDIETGADIRFQEIEAKLDGHESEQKRFEERIRSQEAETARLSALFHGLRSSDPQKHRRLGALTVACIFADDMLPERLDDVMRAGVELSESDIFLLGRIYKLQVHIIRDSTSSDSDRLQRITSDWTTRTKLKSENGGIELSKCRGSLARLQAQAFLQLRTPGFDAGAEIVVLLEDGARFYERLQETGKNSETSR
jgi:hypothetical protein